MTLTSIRNQIIGILLKNEMFILEQDSKLIKVPKQLNLIKNSLIEESLKLLESSGFLSKIKNGDNCYWLLYNDPSHSDQELKITYHTADAIANIINQYREAMGIKSGECDKTNIIEEDIQSLVIICGNLLNNVEKNNPDKNNEQPEDGDENDNE
jgi:Fe2+ or Zn2+ uptake regulation protein